MPAFPAQPTDGISASLDAVPTGTAVSAVAKRLLDLFTSGDIAPGTRLPPERQLAASLGIGRSAVREALAALEILGLVDVRPGSGTYLRGTASELLPETLNWGVMINASRTAELIAIRSELEVMAARLAATRISDDDLVRLDRSVDAMRANVENPSRFIEADLKCHMLIARVAGNQVLLDLLQSIRSLLRVWVERGISDPADAGDALAEHAALADALRSRDPASVEQAMRAHMATATGRLERTVPEAEPDTTG
jgi:GntR family transcriptional repressor for pyruvate dehydrogenase complex